MQTLKGKLSVGVYVPTFTESDPTVPEHVKAITQEQIENWDNGTGSVVQEQEPTVPQYVKNITEEQINNWNNPRVITKTSELENDSGFITGYTETDPSVPQHVKNITIEDITKWNSNTGGGTTTEYELPIASAITLGGVKIGDNLSIDENGVLSATRSSSTGGTTNYTDLTNKPSINGVELSGNKTLDDLGIQPKGNYALKSEIPTNTVSSTNVTNIVTLTQNEYDVLSTKDNSTLYIIVG